jgi:hypothetical protein
MPRVARSVGLVFRWHLLGPEFDSQWERIDSQWERILGWVKKPPSPVPIPKHWGVTGPVLTWATERPPCTDGAGVQGFSRRVRRRFLLS